MAIFDIANHLSHKWKKPDYYLNYACAGYQDLPVEFEYTFVLGGHTLLYNYSKVALELKGNIVREQLIVDGNEVLLKDKDVLNIANEFGLTQTAIEDTSVRTVQQPQIPSQRGRAGSEQSGGSVGTG